MKQMVENPYCRHGGIVTSITTCCTHNDAYVVGQSTKSLLFKVIHFKLVLTSIWIEGEFA